MKNFRIIFFYELRKTINYKNLIAFIIILLICSYSFNNGLNKYKNTQKKNIEFIKVEKTEFKQFINYLQYGTHGFKIYFSPVILVSFFYNSNIFTNIEAKIDSGVSLDILRTFKGDALFEDRSGGFRDFSGIIFMFGSLLSLIFGYRTFFNRRQMKYYNEFITENMTFLSQVISRVIILLLFFFTIFIPSIIIFSFENINIQVKELNFLIFYFIILVGINIFFFITGIVIETIKSHYVSFFIIILIWSLYIFVIPGLISSIIGGHSVNITSIFQIELNKLKVLMNFEKRAIEKAGTSKPKSNNTQIERKIVEDYFKHEFVQLQAFEKKLEKEIEENVRLYHLLSSFFPSTLYLSASNEISSRGYNSFLEFYRYVQDLKRKFLRFYIDKKFYSNFPKMKKNDDGSAKVRFAKVESFVKNDENIFRSKPSLPRYFGLGLGLLFSYILILFIISYIRFKTILKR